MNTDDLGQTIRNTVQAALEGVGDVAAEVVGAAGVIKDQGLLDLTGARSPEDLAHLKVLKDVGLVLVPESLASELNKIVMKDVGATVPVPDGGRVRTYTGQLKLAGDAFAGEDCIEDVIVIAGQVVFTTPVTEIRAKAVVIAGQVLAPKASERTLGPAITRLAGQLLYYPDQAKPRILMGQDSFAEAFFQLLREPEVLVLIGDFSFEDDVQIETLRERLAGLMIVGKVSCHQDLKPALQALCDECLGTIEAR